MIPGKRVLLHLHMSVACCFPELAGILVWGINGAGRNLVECARVAVRKDAHLKEFYQKLRRKRGERKALIAVARKMVAYAYWMLKRNQTYEELAPWTHT
jgi:hypothetical protein